MTDHPGIGAIVGSGLHEKARAALRRRSETSPGDGPTWMRLADLERATGGLEEAARCYRRAAALGCRVKENETAASVLDETGALSGSTRLAPFLLRRSPIPSTLIERLLAMRDTDPERHARVGDDRTIDVTARAATVWPVPEAARAELLHACAEIAVEAAARLLGEPVDPTNVGLSLIDYADGGGFARHRDVGEAGSSYAGRVLTLIHYLDVSRGWLDGGDLLLHDRSGAGFTRLPPRSGTVIAFAASDWHQVTTLRAAPDASPPPRRTVLSVWYRR